VQRQPIAFFTRAQTGSLVSRLNSDRPSAPQAGDHLDPLVDPCPTWLTLILVLIAMVSLSWLVDDHHAGDDPGRS